MTTPYYTIRGVMLVLACSLVLFGCGGSSSKEDETLEERPIRSNFDQINNTLQGVPAEPAPEQPAQ
jgi:hypothetical protein